MWTAAIGSLRSENEVAVRKEDEFLRDLHIRVPRCGIITRVKLYSGILPCETGAESSVGSKRECG